MSLFKEWSKLMENQTEATFDAFWKEYSGAETEIYKDILANKRSTVSGVLGELAKSHDVRPVIFMGFLDGIQTSLNNPFDLETITEESSIELDIDFQKLFYNMINADADYLFSLDEWEDILTIDERKAIADEWRRSRTVVKEKEPGRNDPCPCGSGKKYKKCCGAK